MISLQASDIFFCIRYDYLQDQIIQRADVLHTVCFPSCLFEICAKCVEGQCRNFFPGLLCVHELFFHLIFPCMNFLFVLRPPPTPPPITFLIVPSLGTVANLDARDFLWAVSGFGHFFYSERCAHICLAPSQNSNVWRPNIHV